MKPLIKKDHHEYPDFYGMTVHYNTGNTEEYQVGMHRIADQGFTLMEIVTHDDRWHLIPLSNVCRFELDKNFSKIMAIKEREAKKVKKKKENKK